MISYRMYCNPSNKTVLGCKDDGQKLNRPQIESRLVFKSELDTVSLGSFGDKLVIVQWAPFVPITGLAEGEVNENLWLHFGYEPVGSLVVGQRLDQTHHLRCLSEVIALARAEQLDLFATLPENHEALSMLHTLLHGQGALPYLGPVLTPATVCQSKYDFWEAQ